MLKKKSKGQSSVEYLSIVAIALMVLIPGSYLFFNYSKGTTEQVSANQLNLAGNDILRESEKMYVLGKNSWVTVELSLPGTFLGAGIHNGSEMYFKYGGSHGESYAVFFPVNFKISNSTSGCSVDDCPLNFNTGINSIRIKSEGDFVSIRKVS